MKKIISLKNISKRFGGVKAVEDVSLDLLESEVCGIVGHNGAGKTVLMNILSGVYNSDTGQIYYYGDKVNFMPCVWNTGLSYDPFLYGVSVGADRFTSQMLNNVNEYI